MLVVKKAESSKNEVKEQIEAKVHKGEAPRCDRGLSCYIAPFESVPCKAFMIFVSHSYNSWHLHVRNVRNTKLQPSLCDGL